MSNTKVYLFEFVFFLYGLFVFLPLLIVRFAIKYGFRKEIISLQSSNFMFDENYDPDYNISVNLKLQGVLNFELFLDRIQSKMINNSKNSYLKKHCELFYGYVVWVDENKFRIREHAENVCVADEDEFKSWLLDSDQAPFERQKSPWKFTVINSQDVSWVVFKFHHVLGDGYAISSALLQCIDSTDDIILPKVSTPTNPSYWNCIKTTHDAFRKLIYLRPSDISLGWKPLRKSFFKSKELSFESLRATVKNKSFNCTSIFLHKIAEAITRSKAFHHSEEISFTLTVPSSRPKTSGQEYLDNHLKFACFSISTTNSSQKKIFDTLRSLTPLTLLLSCISDFICVLPMRIKNNIVNKMVHPRFVVSIFPGSRKEMRLLGHTVQSIDYLLPINKFSATMISIFTYNGKFSFWLSTFLDQHYTTEMGKYLEEEFSRS